ncbi:hypothetical protein PFISCL1PPCAC_26245, partial [Pristionchus fissidentatus]
VGKSGGRGGTRHSMLCDSARPRECIRVGNSGKCLSAKNERVVFGGGRDARRCYRLYVSSIDKLGKNRLHGRSNECSKTRR